MQFQGHWQLHWNDTAKVLAEHPALDVPCTVEYHAARGRAPASIDALGAVMQGMVSSYRFKNALDEAGGKDVVVRINSPGGDVMEGFGIYNLLKEYPGKVQTRVTGQAASAGALIFLAGDERLVPTRGGLVMVHEVWAPVLGLFNKTKLETLRVHMEDVMTKLDAQQAQILADAADMDEAEAEEALKAETWYTPREARKAGLATGTYRTGKADEAAAKGAAASAKLLGAPEGALEGMAQDAGDPQLPEAQDVAPQGKFDFERDEREAAEEAAYRMAAEMIALRTSRFNPA